MPAFKFNISASPRPKIMVRGTNWLGDAVMTLPALKALRLNFPQSLISLLSKKSAEAPYLLSGLIEEFLPLEKKGRHRGFGGLWRLASELRRKKFDGAVLFQNAFGAALTAFLAGIPLRLGYARDGRGFLLKPAIALEEKDYYQHEIFYYLNILEKAGLFAPFSQPVLTVPEGLRIKVRAHLDAFKGGEFLLALAPGAAYGRAKRWPAENFAEAARLILAERKGAALIFGGPEESEVAEEVGGLLKKRGLSFLNLAGKLDLADSLAVLEQADFLLSNDSGLMHLGGALGRPLAAAFGPTNTLTTAPLWKTAKIIKDESVECSPCLKRDCPLPRRRCFDKVTPDLMAGAALEILAESERPAAANRAVFLDRDGTINEEVEYLKSPDQLRLIPKAGAAIAALNRAGFKVIVVTNQSGLARGYFTASDLKAVHRKMEEMLAAEGARIDAFHHCPHHPEGTVPELSVECRCRKPSPFLFELAARDFNIDLKSSYWVGDRARDVSPAKKLGGKSALVLTGYGLAEARQNPLVNLAAPDLYRAVEWILS